MLVYGTRLWFSAATEFQPPLSIVAGWLGRKIGRQLVASRFLANGDRTFDGDHQLKSIATIEAHPAVVAIIYTHPDQQVRGRFWTTEIGFRRAAANADLECTVLLSTSEVSARVAAPVQVTQPGLIADFADRFQLSEATDGTDLRSLAEDDAEAFRRAVLDPHRTGTLVVMSPTISGSYMADAQRLRPLLLGLANLFVIPQGADTFWLAKAIGSEFVPYRGAVRLIYPLARRFDASSAPTRVLTVSDIAALTGEGKSIEQEILSLIVHRSNRQLSLNNVGIQLARDLQLQRVLAQKRIEAAKSGDAQDYAQSLEARAIGLENTVAEQKLTIEGQEKLIAEAEDKERALRYENDAVKQHLAEAGRRPAQSQVASEGRESFARAVFSAVEGDLTPETCLRLLDHLYPDRVVILPSAWQSARASASFKYSGKLLGLLESLATTYWESLNAGQPDSKARQVFGNSYAARESDTVANRKSASDRRTFEYCGTAVLMLKHLKIGTPPNAAETIRVHFEWMADDAVIAIGHCGPHIPFR